MAMATAPAASPPAVELHPAGMPRLCIDGRECLPATRKGLALALLAALDAPLRRARAAELLWPGPDAAAARRNLRRELFRLRGQGLPLADVAPDALQLPVQLHWPPVAALAPRWLEGLDDAAGAELAGWLDEQRARLQHDWVAQLVAQACALDARGDAAALRAWQAVLADAAGGPGHTQARAAVQRLAAADPSPDPAPDAPAFRDRNSGRSLPFVGREAERQAIAQALQQRRLVLIDGAPGVGKTRLAQEALSTAQGLLLLRCRPEDAAVPYASAMRGLQALREAAPDTLPPPWVRRTLAPLVPDWSAGPADGGAADPPPPERLRQAWRAAVATLAEGNFGALVVDDWQWIDGSSLALLDPGNEGPPLPCLVLHRSGELPPAVLQQRRRWLDGGQAVALRVPPLADAEAAALLQAAGAAPADCAALAGRAAGNPLFLLETLRHVQQRGGDLMPETVHELIVARARALGATTRRVLEAASVADDDWRTPVLAQVAGLDELATAQALEHAAAAELLLADVQGRHRFAHDLLAQSLADSLSLTRLRALHGQWAQALAAQGGEPGRVARHLERADRGAEAAPWHLRAAQVARQRHAWAAMRDAAAAAAGSAADPAQRLQARLAQALACRRLADTAAAEAALDAALADAAAAGPQALIDLDLARAELLANTGRADPALALLDALQTDPLLQPAQRQQMQVERANALGYLGRHAESLAMLRQALDGLPPSALLQRQPLLSMASRAAYWAGELQVARSLIQDMLALARALGDGAAEAASLFRLGVLDREQGRSDAAAGLLEQAAAAARRIGATEVLRSALSTLATVRLDQMRLAEAEALLSEGEQAAPYWESPLVEDVYDERRRRLHMLRGEVDAAWALWRHSLQRLQRLDHRHFQSAVLLEGVRLALLTGEVPLARRHLQAARALYHDDSDGLHGRELAVYDSCVLQAEGQAAAALQVAEDWLALQHDRRNEELAWVHLAAAQAALDLQRRADAARHLDAVAALPPLPIPQQAEVLAARLRLARTGAAPLAPARQAAERWLALPERPRLEEALLRRALG